jgi:hypothetical protein
MPNVFDNRLTDWIPYTPTGTWTTNTVYVGRWRRVGDSAEIQINVNISGNPDNTQLIINLPSGLVIDTSKQSSDALNSLQNLSTYVGGVFCFGSGTIKAVAYYETPTSITALYVYQGEFSSGDEFAELTGTVPWSDYHLGGTVSLSFSVPIVGWS